MVDKPRTTAASIAAPARILLALVLRLLSSLCISPLFSFRKIAHIIRHVGAILSSPGTGVKEAKWVCSDYVRQPSAGGSRLIRNKFSCSRNAAGVENGFSVVQRLDRGALACGFPGRGAGSGTRRGWSVPKTIADTSRPAKAWNQPVLAASAANQ